MYNYALPAAGDGVLVFTSTHSFWYGVAAVAFLVTMTAFRSSPQTWSALPVAPRTPPVLGGRK